MPDRQSTVVAEQHDMIQAANGMEGQGMPAGFKPNAHPDAQWFRTAGLGLFLHWGLSSVDGQTDLSWGMIKQRPGGSARFKTTPPQYYAQAQRFNPRNYHPEKWLAKAAAAGFTYAVLTTKHHEGFALWPSMYGDLNTKNYMGGRDLVAPFVDACRQVGLKVGLYFSPPDWWYCRNYMSFSYPDQPAVDFDHRPAVIPKPPEDFGDALLTYTRSQIEELLTRYGKIDILFFDGCVRREFSRSHIAISMERLRELQPGMVVNPRMHGYGDYLTPESHMPETRPPHFFELCDISDRNAWGYLNDRHRSYFPPSRFIERLFQCRGWGGNYLLNMGPAPDGDLPPEAYETFEAIKNWSDLHKAAVQRVDSGGYPESCNVPETRHGATRYLYVAPEGAVETLVLQSAINPLQVRWLGTDQVLPFDFTGREIRIRIAPEQRPLMSGVVAVTLPSAGDGL